ncbi:hypothetical protein [Candidatus Magnetominusculus xianensis]|uniref:UPF0323 domain-containing protein n=1 Tax=Candidatus Magnetominusculus xianensis TaxID=1748249 RepID=A0ABR5SGC5_9BACT|nr:hypothetical protein [Candidatus Magnetominusculus xianensis]KWT85570.1 hypothetical protein ASN18_1704 [Candidatus Magnetominusculus xianensis]MBF0404199.1 hypothetical protein [Nitrospirota bacterium]
MHKKIKTASVGSIFFLANALLTTSGCSPELKDCPPQFANASAAVQKYGVITEVQEIEKGEFKIVNEVPSKCSGVMVTHIDGSVEIIPQQKAETMVRDVPPNSVGLGLGTVLASGLFGYMLGRTSFISSGIYANEGIYRQTLARKDIITRKTGREDNYAGGSGSGGRYGGSATYGSTSSSRGGFFSRIFGSGSS